MSTADAIRASKTGTLNPTSMSGEKRLCRVNDEIALLLDRWCIEISSSLFNGASEINALLSSGTF